MAGLTTQGFTTYSTEELRTIIANALIANLGGDIDTNPSSRIGQFIDIVADNLSSLWNGLEAVYNSQYPNSASGTSLDNVGSITNTQRNPGRYGFARVYFNGTIGTSIPSGTVVSNQGGYELATTTTATIAANCWLLYVDLLPTSQYCTLKLYADGDPCLEFDIFSDTAPSVTKSNIVAAGVVTRTLGATTRNGTIATITTTLPHGFSIGQSVTQAGTTGGFWNGTFTINGTPTTTSYTYLEIGGPVSGSGGTSAGQILTSGEVEVLGQFNLSGGIWIKFTPIVTSRVYSISVIDNLLTKQTTDVVLTVDNSTETYIEVLGSVLENQNFPAHSIIEIVSPLSNIDSVVNIEVGLSAAQRATDADYRLQIAEDLQASGSSTVSSIKKAVSSLVGVSFVGLIENATNGTVASRPAHSYEIFVEGGDDDEVAQTIYDTHPPGIQIVTLDGSPRVGAYTDVNGVIQSLSFSNIEEVNVFVTVTGTKNSAYPVDGDDQVSAAILAYINSRGIGEVLYMHNLYTPANTIPGISTLTITGGKVGFGATSSVTPTAIQRVFVVVGDISITIT